MTLRNNKRKMLVLLFVMMKKQKVCELAGGWETTFFGASTTFLNFFLRKRGNFAISCFQHQRHLKQHVQQATAEIKPQVISGIDFKEMNLERLLSKVYLRCDIMAKLLMLVSTQPLSSSSSFRSLNLQNYEGTNNAEKYVGKILFIKLRIKRDFNNFHEEVSSKTTGWPKSKFFISNSCISDTMHFWPHVVKTISGLKSSGFFWKL